MMFLGRGAILLMGDGRGEHSPGEGGQQSVKV